MGALDGGCVLGEDICFQFCECLGWLRGVSVHEWLEVRVDLGKSERWVMVV